MEQSTTTTTTTTINTQRRRGRKHKPEAERRSISVTVKLNQFEAEALGLKCAELGTDVPNLFRAAALGNNIQAVPALNRQAYAELARLAGNLNQLTKHCNNGTGGIISGEQLAPAIQRVHAEVQKLRAELLGA